MENTMNPQELADLFSEENYGVETTIEDKSTEKKEEPIKKDNVIENSKEVEPSEEDIKKMFEEEGKEVNNPKSDSWHKSAYQRLVEEELALPLEEGVELKSEEDFLDQVEKGYEKHGENVLKSIYENLGEEGARYLKFINDGGNPQEYYKAFLDNSPTVGDEPDAKNKTKWLEWYFKNQEGESSEEATRSVELIKDRDKLDSAFKKYKARYTRAKELREKDILEKTSKRKADQVKAQRQYFKDLQESVKTFESLSLNETTDSYRRKLIKYLGTKDFQDKISNTSAEHMLILADLAYNDFKVNRGKTTQPIKSNKRKRKIINDNDYTNRFLESLY